MAIDYEWITCDACIEVDGDVVPCIVHRDRIE